MRQRLVKTLVVLVPFVTFLSWASIAQGCVQAEDQELAQEVPFDAGLADAAGAADVLLDANADSCETDTSYVGNGAPVYQTDTNSQVDVAFDAGVSDSGVLESGAPDLPAPDSGQCETPIAFRYDGPASPGSIWIEAWWQPPAAPARAWGVIPECADLIPNDGILDCIFSVPCGTTSLEFQVYLPGARYWGDTSCSSGGCGSTVGTVWLKTSSGDLPYVLIPNPWGSPWMNGFVSAVH